MSVEYTHQQTVPAEVWTISHGMNAYPVTDVIITHEGTRQKILPRAVKYIDSNTIEVVFSTPLTGLVRLIGGYKFSLPGVS